MYLQKLTVITLKTLFYQLQISCTYTKLGPDFSPVCGVKKTPRLHHLVDVNLELLDDGLHDVIDVAELAGLAPLGAVENPGTVDSNVHRLLAKLQSAGYGFTAAQPT